MTDKGFSTDRYSSLTQKPSVSGYQLSTDRYSSLTNRYQPSVMTQKPSVSGYQPPTSSVSGYQPSVMTQKPQTPEPLPVTDIPVPHVLFSDILTGYVDPRDIRLLSKNFNKYSEHAFGSYVKETEAMCTEAVTLEEIIALSPNFDAIVTKGNTIGLYMFRQESGKTKMICLQLFNSLTGEELEKPGYALFNPDVVLTRWVTFIYFDIASVRRVLKQRRGCPGRLASNIVKEMIENIEVDIPELADMYLSLGAVDLGLHKDYVDAELAKGASIKDLVFDRLTEMR